MFIKVSEKMKWFDTKVGAFDRSFQQRPEILKSICMNGTVNIRFRMVDNLLGVFIKIVVGLQSIGIQFRTRRDVLRISL